MDAAVAGPPRAIDLGLKRPFRVGEATIDPVSREAQFAGGRERLQPQNLKVLIALVRRRGEVVTRDELIEACWEGRIVGDDVINRSISTLRHFAQRAGGFSIETVPRAGYRLVEDARPTRRHARRRLIGAVILIAAAIAGILLLAQRGRQPSDQLTLTVAILPFASDPNDLTTQQVASQTRETVARMLSHSGLAVKLVDAAPRNRAAADLVIAGDVGAEGRQVFASVRMEDRAHRAIVLSHRFAAARDEAAATLPDQIGAHLAGSLSWTARLILIDRRHPSDPSITAEIFKQIELDSMSALRAYEFARRVAPKAPNSLLAQLHLAFGTAFALSELPPGERAEAVAAALRAADRAQALGPEFGDVYAPWCLLHSPVRMAQCEDRLRTAMTRDPDAPFVAHFLSELLNKAGRNREALDQARMSLAHDQYVVTKIGHLLRMLEVTGSTREAGALHRQAVRWYPDSDILFWQRLAGITERGDFAAIEPLEKTVGRAKWPDGYEPIPELTAAVAGNSLAAARAACPRAQASQSFKSIQCMLALARLGDLDGAFAFADHLFPPRVGRTPEEEQALWLRQPWSTEPSYIASPAAAPLRRDPRFFALARRVGLLDYWRARRLPDFCRLRPEPICAKILARS